MKKFLIHFSLSFTLIFATGCKNVDLNQVASAIEQYQPGLDRETVTAGLKQALEVGTKNSVAKTSRRGGFGDDPAIKILVPTEMAKLAKNMRRYGFGQYVDRFESQLNRTAEYASAEAKAIFIESITQMSVGDAWSILNGQDDAATQYFRKNTKSRLKTRFKPKISQSMAKVGFYSDYRKLLDKYNALPLADKPNLDIEDYIMQKTLDGLFIKVAEEETKIRHNPAARVTELLRKVFAN